jgi:hypothetical protein
VKERREQALVLQEAVEKSRQEWLGKRIRFRDLLDEGIKEGVFVHVDDTGWVLLEYQMFAWPDEPPTICTQVGHEEELLSLIEGVVARFLLDCRVRVRTERTIKLYQFALALLVSSLDDLCGISDLEQVTVTHLRLCVHHLLTEPLLIRRGRYPKNGHMLTVSTVRCYARIWKIFFNWCDQEELMDKNPADRLNRTLWNSGCREKSKEAPRF